MPAVFIPPPFLQTGRAPAVLYREGSLEKADGRTEGKGPDLWAAWPGAHNLGE